MRGRTISEKILATKSGEDGRAGNFLVCNIDLAIGTDGSAPMAIDYFERMGGKHVFDPDRILFSLDHYAPPASADTARLHDRMRTFGQRHGITVLRVGDGISFQRSVEIGRVRPGMLVVGADSHTVTCGAVNAFATGIGSSDLAAAMISGKVWLRVPASIKVRLDGRLPSGVYPKDIVLALLEILGPDGANYKALEFHGAGVTGLSLEDRLVLSNMAVEMGAKAGIFSADGETLAYLESRSTEPFETIHPDPDAMYDREVVIDMATLAPKVALPHNPENVVPIGEAAGTPVDMVFIGTCTGGRVPDFHQVLEIMELGGGAIAPGVQLVLTPVSREVFLRLIEDGTLPRLAAMGATITTPGCGPCCGSSGPIPGDGMNVVSTANRNFKGRMGNVTVSIYLTSPATCAAAAVTGRIADPRELKS